jgi:hypothetical protein
MTKMNTAKQPTSTFADQYNKFKMQQYEKPVSTLQSIQLEGGE